MQTFNKRWVFCNVYTKHYCAIYGTAISRNCDFNLRSLALESISTKLTVRVTFQSQVMAHFLYVFSWPDVRLIIQVPNHLTTFTDAVFPRRLNTVDFWPLMRHSFWLSAFLDIVTSILHLLTSKLLHNLVDMATFPSTLGLPGFYSTEQSSMELPLHGEKANVSGTLKWTFSVWTFRSRERKVHNPQFLHTCRLQRAVEKWAIKCIAINEETYNVRYSQLYWQI